MNARKRRGQFASLVGLGALVVAMVIGGIGRPGTVGAQESTPTATGSSPAVVNVVGHGSVNVAPDIATTTIGVTITQPAIGDAQSQAKSAMTDIIAALKDAGVKSKDIQTSYYSVSVMSNYDNNGSPTEITGYQVTNQVNVVIRDIEKVSDILEAAVGAGANTIYGVSFSIADPKQANSDARAAAVADAKATAEELAAAAGLTLGRVVSISEGTFTSMPYAYGQGAGGKAGGGIEAGSMAVSVDVQVTYELV